MIIDILNSVEDIIKKVEEYPSFPLFFQNYILSINDKALEDEYRRKICKLSLKTIDKDINSMHKEIADGNK